MHHLQSCSLNIFWEVKQTESCWFNQTGWTVSTLQAALEAYWDIPNYYKYFPFASLTHGDTSVPSVHSRLRRSTSSHQLSGEKACHRRSKTLTISEFTSAQVHGQRGQTDHPTAWSSRTKTQRRESEGGRQTEKKKGGGEGVNKCGYLLSVSPAEMCWNETSFYIWCALSCEAMCTVSIKVLFIIAYACVTLCT